MTYQDPKKVKAKQVLETTGNRSQAAREAGVDRTTLYRWLKDGSLNDIEVEEDRDLDLDELRRKAIKLLDSALDGQKVTAIQIRAAQEVIRTSKSVQTTEEQSSLVDLITELDAEASELGD